MLNINFFIPVILVCSFFIIHKIFNGKYRRNHPPPGSGSDAFTCPTSPLDVQENAFRKISQEIHDNISLTLSLSRLYLSDLDLDDKPQSHDKINMAVVLLKRGIADLNNLSKSLNPDTIEKFGFIKAIEEQVNDIRKTGRLNVEFIITGNRRKLSAGNDLILFRIIQESLNNILKHSRAEHAVITLEYLQSELVLFVHDDGCGFNVGMISPGSGLGNMQKRAEMLKAKLEIESSPKSGTSIKVIVPVNNNPHLYAHGKPCYQDCTCR